MKITHHQLAKLLKTEPKVALINGLYQKYEWRLTFSRYAISIILKTTHPSLLVHAGMKKTSEWATVLWTSKAAHTGTVHECLHEGLEDWAKEKEALYAMSDSQAEKLLNDWIKAWNEYSKAMGISSK